MFIGPPYSVSLRDIERTYLATAQVMSDLMRELPIHIEHHRMMFTDGDFDRKYVADYNRAMDLLLPDADGAMPDYQSLDCDYTAQPLNALWFNANAVLLVDRYGTELFGSEWEARREVLKKAHRILEVEEISRIRIPAEPPKGAAWMN